MTIPQFIEKAIEGRWMPPSYANVEFRPYSWKVQAVVKAKHKERFFLDPEAWKAVGKVEGWPNEIDTPMKKMAGWEYNMHRMIDALAHGKSVEDFVAKL